ncbi:MAG: ABC transporter permease [Actinobacteria bacterium]|nr:ABC transporter permease [Actinomycetota bacterium]
MTAPTNLDRRGGTAAVPPDATAGGRTGTGGAWLLGRRRELMVKATDRSFLIGTVVTLAIIAGIMVLQVVLAGRTSTYDVAVTPSATTIAQQVRDGAAAIDEDVVVTPLAVPDDAAARAAVLDESADAWLHRDGDRWVLTTKDGPNDSLTAVTQEVVRAEALRANASAAGTTLEALERGATLETAFLEGDAQRAELVDALAFAFTFLFYIAALTFGVTLANSVVEEKQSRVVEIIATAIPVRHLLAGKVLGNTVLAVAQLTLFVAVGLVGLAFTDYSSLVTAVSGPIVWFVVFFLAGFISLACLWAVAGSLASRTEDLQSTTTPLTFLVMAVLFGGLLLEGQWQVIGSFVPPLSAVVMPIRLLQGDASWPEALLALAILLAAAGATVRVGERLYRRSLLQSGGRVTVRQAWRVEE